jgi:phenylpropionate dioxygenase-like ring-hydroxylating dioxygenase large terminal subunit
VARGPDRGVHAFHNVCQHRGVRLVREAGRAEASTLTWAYLGPVGDELPAYDMSRWRLVGTTQWTIPANWKAVIDGFHEDPPGRRVDDARPRPAHGAAGRTCDQGCTDVKWGITFSAMRRIDAMDLS